jgi:hypothetical protein
MATPDDPANDRGGGTAVVAVDSVIARLSHRAADGCRED